MVSNHADVRQRRRLRRIRVRRTPPTRGVSRACGGGPDLASGRARVAAMAYRCDGSAPGVLPPNETPPMSQPDLQALWLQAVAHFEREELQEAEALCIQLVQRAPERPLA